MLFVPLDLAKTDVIALAPTRSAALTGWAIDEGGAPPRDRRGVPALGFHDFPGLLAFARESRASEILDREWLRRRLAGALRDLGMNAQPLEAPPQLELF